jgi:ribonuclease P protein component
MSTSESFEGKTAGSVPSFRLETIKTRPEFKAANAGPRYSTPGFTLLRRPEAAGAGIRFGFTVTKKLGKAVLRNRIRRRLRAAARAAQAMSAAQMPPGGFDFVVLARGAAAELPLPTLAADIARAMVALAHKAARAQKTPSNPA